LIEFFKNYKNQDFSSLDKKRMLFIYYQWLREN